MGGRLWRQRGRVILFAGIVLSVGLLLLLLLVGKSIFGNPDKLPEALEMLLSSYATLSGIFACFAAFGLVLGAAIWPGARHFVEQLALVLILLILLATLWPSALTFIARHAGLTIGIFVLPNLLHFLAIRSGLIDRLFHFDPLHRERTIVLNAPRAAVWSAIVIDPDAAGRYFQKTLTNVAEGDAPGQFHLTHEWSRKSVTEVVDILLSIPETRQHWRSRIDAGDPSTENENTIDLLDHGSGTKVIWRQVYARPSYLQMLAHYLDDDLADDLALLRHRVDGGRDRSLLSAVTRTRRCGYQTGSISPSAR
ncbi:hypothetical protein EU803_06030 [Loktanella sp. IMCC34160]|uniref:SRPBCC family protein n=1 Tax=Loktanella sp. IMCC34160 TaxID=2510646 RepID=UPI00101CDE65|nr:hypothetical protein [Loktanella sp. IMCC34160]RYG92008.1 hypothetical protein EU803_06030 [Loktanella sp. IMCC34160]